MSAKLIKYGGLKDSANEYAAMRKITADIIYPVSSEPLKDGVVLMDDEGHILDVLPSRDGVGDLEKVDGVLVPGFINAHCHLELSYLKGKISEGTGLDGFIRDLEKQRGAYSDEQRLFDAILAEKEMRNAGIVGVGDIMNTLLTVPVKRSSDLSWFSFLEVYGFSEKRIDEIWHKGVLDFMHMRTFRSPEKLMPCTLVPHAPYSVSEKLFEKMSNSSAYQNAIGCIHLAESDEEVEFLLHGTGKIADRLHDFGIDQSDWTPPGIRPLQFVLPKMMMRSKALFVHNTVLNAADFEWLAAQPEEVRNKVHFCFCPGANLFIEKRLPDFKLFLNAGYPLMLGTDSLASNIHLSILEEMKLVTAAVPTLDTQTALEWACLNPARFFGWDNALGSIEKGKKPGLNLLSGLDANQRITESTTVDRIA